MHEKSGKFSIRSSYRMIVETKKRREDWLESRPAASNSREDEHAWVRLWKTMVPAKIRVFLWRLARQSIPTDDVRMHRNMTTRCTCAICGTPDSWKHSLLECTAARCVWSLVDQDLIDELQSNTEQNARRWLFTMIEKIPHEKFIKVSVTLWAIWIACRKLIHEGINQSPLSTHLFISQFISELGEIQNKGDVQRGGAPPQKPIQQVKRWIAPPEGKFKINVDAGISIDHDGDAGAAICRDHEGNYLGSSILVIHGMLDPATVEAVACREALSLAQDLGMQHLLVASDCKQVINHI